MIDEPSPRIDGIAFGILLLIIYWYAFPDIYEHHYYPWPHKWTRVYCNHALLIIHLDDAEKQCKPGPVALNYMSYYQPGARYPLFWIVLNAVPYSFPVIAGFLVLLVLPRPRDRHQLTLQLNRFLVPIIIVACLSILAVSYYLATNYIQGPGYCEITTPHLYPNEICTHYNHTQWF